MDARSLVARYIELNPNRPGAGEARLVGYGIPVWAIIGHYQATGRDARYVADSYEVPLEAVQAALAYYRRHRSEIEARLAANAA